MSKIRIKNFGPIRDGYSENDGWLEVKKVTVFIGNQGSGKSTVAKVISIMTWLEKGLYRGDVKLDNLLSISSELSTYFEYQRLEKYFRQDTLIEYQGEFAHITVRGEMSECVVVFSQKRLSRLPKVMYIPAERNFLTVVQDAYDVKNIPATLKTFGEELKKSMLALNGSQLELPIGTEKIKYDKAKDKIFLVLDHLDLEISDSSSGYQSLVPLFAVSQYLSQEIQKNVDNLDINLSKLSINQSVRRQAEIDEISNGISSEEKKKLIDEVNGKYFTTCFINIVEEPEQNLFPSSQRQMLNSLLAFNNRNTGNQLIMTTHSPYLINYLTLAVKANTLKEKIHDSVKINSLQEIVPLDATISAQDLVIYELNEKEGSIKKLRSYNGLPSDENELNQMLGEGNKLFGKLLDLEDSWQ